LHRGQSFGMQRVYQISYNRPCLFTGLNIGKCIKENWVNLTPVVVSLFFPQGICQAAIANVIYETNNGLINLAKVYYGFHSTAISCQSIACIGACIYRCYTFQRLTTHIGYNLVNIAIYFNVDLCYIL
jgi:hypothetical protein